MRLLFGKVGLLSKGGDKFRRREVQGSAKAGGTLRIVGSSRAF